MIHIIRQKLIFFLLMALWLITTIPGFNANIMTFNIRRNGHEKKTMHTWRKRKHLVCNIIRQYQPDIYSLQEATIDQIQTIAQQFPQYHWVGNGRGSRYCGYAKDEHVPIFYDTNKYSLIDFGTFTITKGSSNPCKWKRKGKLTRIATWVYLKEKQSQMSLIIYNTHLDYDRSSLRLTGLTRIMEHAKLHTNQQATILVMGDFNEEYVNTIQQIGLRYGFCNTKEISSNIQGPYKTAIDWKQKEKNCIDHILIKPSRTQTITCHQHLTIRYPHKYALASDHYPVLINISLEPTSVNQV